MLVGSCRLLPFVNYLVRLNQDNRFTIVLVYVVNFAGNVEQYETKPILLDMIKRCKWFIYEHVENYGFLNTTKEAKKNIYQFGMNPELNISVPNFNDHLILENDWRDYDVPTPDNYVARGNAEIYKFASICQLTSFPEMSQHFLDNWKTTRFFWRPNHTAAAFSLYIFRQMNEKFLHLELSDAFWAAASQEDLFKSPCTQATQRDRDSYGITW